jgi:hypothetical protein
MNPRHGEVWLVEMGMPYQLREASGVRVALAPLSDGTLLSEQ